MTEEAGQIATQKAPGRRYRVMICAYTCNPYRGSEEGVGWGWVRMIAQNHEVHIITAEFEQQDIERWQSEHPDSHKGMRFYHPEHKAWHFHRDSDVWRVIEHSPAKPIMNMAYRLWQREAFGLAAELHRKHRFDLCHLVTYVGFRFPGQFWRLECPFVWGPIGGLENTAGRFLRVLGPYGAVYYATRNLINEFDRRFRPAPKRAFAKANAAGAVIAATPRIRELIQRFYGVDSTVMCEVCPPPEKAEEPVLRSENEPLRLCWAGEHLPGKALPLLLRTLVDLPAGIDWHLDILGDGPYRRRWGRIAEVLGIGSRCHWHGKVPRSEAIRLMHQSHLFVITSLKDLTSTVLLEALFQGAPVICPDHCGFAHVVTPECGIKVPIVNIRQFVQELGRGIARLAADESLRRQLATGALKRASAFDWDSKIEQLNSIYDSVVSRCN